ncbi:hypothetical protein LTR17_024851 [Elasticomyces elasticus]|nr:hypothetical protein LTR17_024851 [Elasticomyces elasticus]
MGKRTVNTKITALPSIIPRQLALDMLHSHEGVVKLNPLVTGVKGIEAPRDARSDEFISKWYEISDIITWGLGLRKKISIKGCFHSQPWGLQTHVYAPMGVDWRDRYRIGGNQESSASFVFGWGLAWGKRAGDGRSFETSTASRLSSPWSEQSVKNQVERTDPGEKDATKSSPENACVVEISSSSQSELGRYLGGEIAPDVQPAYTDHPTQVTQMCSVSDSLQCIEPRCTKDW